MKNTTLCYIEKDGKYLMLHRTKKENDENKDKWIGIGGKLEEGESPEEAAVREAYEETGLRLFSPVYRGIVTFVSEKWGTADAVPLTVFSRALHLRGWHHPPSEDSAFPRPFRCERRKSAYRSSPVPSSCGEAD